MLWRVMNVHLVTVHNFKRRLNCADIIWQEHVRKPPANSTMISLKQLILLNFSPMTCLLLISSSHLKFLQSLKAIVI